MELGAGAGLPSLVSATLGAKQVVVTDYPEPDLISNLGYNIQHNLTAADSPTSADGYLWGAPAQGLKDKLSPGADGFHLLILADILFNHSEHDKLLATLSECLAKSPNAVALVFFTPYRPWLLDKDLHFFDLARAAGFAVDQVMEHTMDTVMFEKDPGDQQLRRTVFGYTIKWRL